MLWYPVPEVLGCQAAVGSALLWLLGRLFLVEWLDWYCIKVKWSKRHRDQPPTSHHASQRRRMRSDYGPRVQSTPC